MVYTLTLALQWGRKFWSRGGNCRLGRALPLRFQGGFSTLHAEGSPLGGVWNIPSGNLGDFTSETNSNAF